ncbi:MAG: DUF1302 domain-containing protein, partial [Epsilonproteobacteria bacterium]|nr:DUF1302 domain-containing protein [Campylobacterota bacterium]
MRLLSLIFLFSLYLIAEDIDELLGGFEDNSKVELNVTDVKSKPYRIKLSQQLLYSKAKSPHDGIYSARTSIFFEIKERILDNFKFKANAKAYYDYLYDKNSKEFTKEELREFRDEFWIYDLYIEGALSSNLDIKAGRQVVVWGKSDSIRITDVLNPLDNRLIGMVDIEDLRIPVGMLKFDYYLENWRISPIGIFEQQFTKNPPYGSQFYLSFQKIPSQKEPSSPSYALNVAGEFDRFDLDFYLARIYPQDIFGSPLVDKTSKVDFYGSSFNFVDGNILYKGEIAYFNGLEYLGYRGDYSRFDMLVGLEYNGFRDTKITIDSSKRDLGDLDINLYQSAFRFTRDFLNSTLHANYLAIING